IGDGMGFSHVAITEAYKALDQTGKWGTTPLVFSQFPVLGMATTYSANYDITDSSAAGTALSTGTKTNNGYLGVDPDGNPLTSISYKIHDSGKKVGIISTVDIDHATPGAFYAHNISRNNYYEIGAEAPGTGFEFFAGGDFAMPSGRKRDQKDLFEMAEEAGYKVVYGIDEFNAAKGSSDKFMLFQEKGVEGRRQNLTDQMKATEGQLTLAQALAAGIEVVNNQDGFFIMTEGGKIDTYAHSNNLEGVIFETLGLEAAVNVAYQFYLQHPDETLIVVTADHETGGLALGKSGYSYDLSVVKEIASGNTAVLEAGTPSEQAQIGWTTFSHCGGNVPVFAVGVGSEQFAGRMNNIDIPKKICSIMGVQF
ncbi:MAG: alkaline phosphatase, partial [Bacteroidales bacterium]|nr:alkaline phosphatase [Bacteroidales bacterium]